MPVTARQNSVGVTTARTHPPTENRTSARWLHTHTQTLCTPLEGVRGQQPQLTAPAGPGTVTMMRRWPLAPSGCEGVRVQQHPLSRGWRQAQTQPNGRRKAGTSEHPRNSQAQHQTTARACSCACHILPTPDACPSMHPHARGGRERRCNVTMHPTAASPSSIAHARTHL